MTEAHMQLVDGLVSVIIVTYNQEALVEETVRSALAQTYDAIEVIVSDDGSTDGTGDVVRAIAAGDRRVKCVFSDKNTGITENCNRGLMASRGEFVAWLGGDDLFLPDKVEKQVAIFRRRPEVALVGTDVEVFFDDGTPSYVARCKAMYKGAPAREFLALPNHIPTSSFMFRRAAVPGLVFDARLRVVSDWLFNVECALAGAIDYVAEPLTRYRRWGKNVTSSGKSRTYLDDRLISTDILLSEYPWLAPDLSVARSNALLSAAKRFALDGDYATGAALSRAAISQHWRNPAAMALLLACWLRVDLGRARLLFRRMRGLRT